MRRFAAVLCMALGLAACTSGRTMPVTSGTRSTSDLPAPASCHPKGITSVGDRLPDCSFRAFDGSVLNLTSLRGKPLVLNFWASWCNYCIKEMPDFEQVHKSVGDKVTIYGADLVGIEGEVESEGRSYAKARGVTYGLFVDQGGLLFAHFSARTILPVTVLVDGDGVVKYRQFGPLDAKSLRGLMAEHLGVN